MSALRLSAALVAVALGACTATKVADSDTLDSAGADADAAASACGVAPAADPLEAKRAACTFAAGAKISETVSDEALATARKSIGHVIVVIKENRSFDAIYGRLGRSDVEAIPATASNPDKNGAPVPAYAEADTCVQLDPSHQWTNMHAMWNGGKLDGFVTNASDHSVDAGKSPTQTDGKFVMGGFTPEQLPFYAFLAKTYALADHYHCATLGGTWANRLYVYAGQSYGVKNTVFDFLPDGTKLIFDALDTAGVTWGVYSDEAFPLDGALLPLGWNASHAGVHPTADFYKQVADGTLPQVVFIDALEDDEDEHPPANVQKGEAWTKKIYDAVVASPLWLQSDGKGVAMIYTYDESGGMYDHVPPPSACTPAADQKEFDRLGFRVPFVLISPYARLGYVSHAVHSHSSLLRLMEGLYDLPALSARDANADALLDMFDFACAPLKTPPVSPASGTGGCNVK